MECASGYQIAVGNLDLQPFTITHPENAFGSQRLWRLILASFVFKVPSPISSSMPWDSNVDGMQIIGRIGPTEAALAVEGEGSKKRGDL